MRMFVCVCALAWQFDTIDRKDRLECP